MNENRLQFRAFTIIELLVVITVAGILTALLLPAIRKGLDSANAAKCSSNLRQVGVGLRLFAADNNGKTPVIMDAPIWTPWNLALVKGGYIAGDPATVAGIFQCPIQKAAKNDYSTGYGMRQPIDPESWQAWRIGTGSIKADGGSEVNSFPSPSKFLIIADSVRSDGYQWYYFDPRSGSTDQIHARHSKKANCLFGDGHVEALSPGDLANRYGNEAGQWPISASAVSVVPASLK